MGASRRRVSVRIIESNGEPSHRQPEPVLDPLMALALPCRMIRAERSAGGATMKVRQGRPPATATRGPSPATLDQHLAALTAGFKNVDWLWKERPRAVFGAYR